MDEFDYSLPGDGEAEEALAAQRERARIDAAASELEAADEDEEIDPSDPHAEERRALGFDLAWWNADGEHGTPVLDIVVDITNHACGRTHYIRDLEEFGFDPKKSTSHIALDAVTGPLVVAGLQILGTLHSHVRAEVEALLKAINDAAPDVSEEQQQSFNDASVKLETLNLSRFAESMGLEDVHVVHSEEELQEVAEQIAEREQQRRDAELN